MKEVQGEVSLRKAMIKCTGGIQNENLAGIFGKYGGDGSGILLGLRDKLHGRRRGICRHHGPAGKFLETDRGMRGFMAADVLRGQYAAAQKCVLDSWRDANSGLRIDDSVFAQLLGLVMVSGYLLCNLGIYVLAADLRGLAGNCRSA